MAGSPRGMFSNSIGAALTMDQDTKVISTKEGWPNRAAFTTSAFGPERSDLPSGSQDAATLIMLNPDGAMACFGGNVDLVGPTL